MTSLDIPEEQVLWRDEDAGAGDYLWSMYSPVQRLTDQNACVWRYSDVAHPQFAERVDDAYLVEATCVARDSVAVVQADENWTAAEWISEADLQLLRDEKANGPGRDRRLLEPTRDSGGFRLLSLVKLMAMVLDPLPLPKAVMTAVTTGTSCSHKPHFFPKDWPFLGPSTTNELLRSVRASGWDLLVYFVPSATRSGFSD